MTLSLSICAEIISGSTVSISHLLLRYHFNDSTLGFSLLVQVADTTPPPPGPRGRGGGEGGNAVPRLPERR